MNYCVIPLCFWDDPLFGNTTLLIFTLVVCAGDVYGSECNAINKSTHNHIRRSRLIVCNSVWHTRYCSCWVSAGY